ncbi:GTP-binding protein gtr1 [Tilletia horrida]|nr:GTP-binding protein gtr1 [Tilletia horrida]KAK0563931.1 GTP-binding protein gtr1 [Tilletia horrida]
MKKVLLMGKSGSGKTSMRSIIFSGYRSEDTRRLGMTIDVERSQVKFLGNIVLSLWDCGGQQSYMDGYINASSKHVFTSVGVLIYVFDLVSSDPGEWGRDVGYYQGCLTALQEYSPQAQVFCLLHKMDKIPASERQAVYYAKMEELKHKSGPDAKVTCFATSIWNESLYFAWSRVVHTLIPNVAILEKHLSQFARICSAVEVVLFEKTTFLVIERSVQRPASSAHGPNTSISAPASMHDLPRTDTNGSGLESQGLSSLTPKASHSSLPEDDPRGHNALVQERHSLERFLADEGSNGRRGFGIGNGIGSNGGQTAPELMPQRFEKIIEMVKDMKSACVKLGHDFQGIEIRAETFSAYLDTFTPNTYIMIVLADPSIGTYQGRIAM